MPKEMIVSVNGREKKIAIIENGLVTEFYIERGEGGEAGSGIVGNIYKGRVQRVLPGMQSAFVDIGLERDAFLYVSDFFDEEEELERIVVEPAKGQAPTPRAAATASPQHQQVAVADPVAVPSHSPTSGGVERRDGADADADVEADSRRRGRRRRGRGEGRDEEARSGRNIEVADAETPEQIRRIEEAEEQRREEEERQRVRAEEIATPFVVPADGFERITDPEEAAATDDGEMLKDAMMQERLTDQIRRIEFDIEDDATLASSSLLGGASANSFERISDDEPRAEAETEGRSKRSIPAVVAAANLASFDDQSEAMSAQSPYTFERISDDEPLAADNAVDANENRPRRPRSRRAGKRETPEPNAEEAAASTAEPVEVADVAANAEVANTEATDEDGAGTKKRRSSSRASATKTTRKSSTASKTTANANSARRSRRTSATADAPEAAENSGESGELFGDAEASMKATPTRGEFARRRRRGGAGNRRQGTSATDENGDGDSSDGDSNPILAAALDDVSSIPEDATATAPTLDADGAGVGADSGSNGVAGVTINETNGGTNRRESRNDRRPGRERRERAPHPTITDLLREGQEILVQIAKEPIAAKGARITSHVALPGRFLVYMPTVEHVGVSRKIESDSERLRLRKLITAIRKEEDVPSGGFIVRTAGTNITEQDLREDARYLVRTWRDIRRGAERSKSPALVHKDLDLVQRLLRDQLSDDFTAIRVDSEEEYLQVVEFVNRIQPRLVSRVKLYTRDEPILESFGVQAEIDKAIKPRVWLKSGGYLVINQTEALVAIDVNTGKFVGRGGSRLEDTITKTNMEAVEEIARQIRLRDLGGIIVLDLIDMEERRNRARVMQALQEALEHDKSPTKVLSFNDFGLVIMTRKRVKQSLERTLCSPCPYCTGAGLVKSPQTVVYEILEEARRLARGQDGERAKQTTLRVHPEVARALRATERDVLAEIEDHLGAVDITSDDHVHQEQFDFALV